MKNILSILLFFVFTKAFTQNDTIKTTNWKEYFEQYNKNNKGNDYVYFYNTQGGIKLKICDYFKCENDYILTIDDYKTDSFWFLRFKEDTLFKYLKKNFASIEKTRNRVNRDANIVSTFKRNFADSNYNMVQIGIRYSGLHFNHFQPESFEKIKEIKDQKTREGEILIATLNSFFENLSN